MHYPWQWLKQRPQFLAETFAEYFNLTVAYRNPYKKANLVPTEVVGNVKIKELRSLPFDRVNAVKKINRILLTRQLDSLLKQNEIVWLTYPELYDWIEKKITDRHFIIYDCMDDTMEFPNTKNNPKLAQHLFKSEKTLCARANLIFCTSERLFSVLQKRYSIDTRKTHVVNNAIHLYTPQEITYNKTIDTLFKSNKVKIVYVGAVAEWFDFEPVLESLKHFDDIEYLFFGPLEVKLPEHPRVKALGTIQHMQVFQVLKNADVLIMPFKVTDLVLGINPVKLYEYIYSCKPVLVKRYPETEKFSPYVTLYSTTEEYTQALRKILEKRAPIENHDERLAFARKNSWPQRAQECMDFIIKAKKGNI